uniref:cohesin subunit SA-1-like n=1 Tax=Myxine glutinosa TaxID=7769 RepID=UPI00358EDB34
MPGTMSLRSKRAAPRPLQEITNDCEVPCASPNPDNSPMQTSACPDVSEASKNMETPVPPKRNRKVVRRLDQSLQTPNRMRQSEKRTAASPTLYRAVVHGQSPTQEILDEWVDLLQEDKEVAFLELVNFIIQSSGCRGEVTLDMVKTMGFSDIIRVMTEKFDEMGADYPLVATGSSWRPFRSSFPKLLQQLALVLGGRSSVMHSGLAGWGGSNTELELAGGLVSLLVGLSDSQVRAFRHTATLAALKFMTGLVGVAVEVERVLQTVQRQLLAEQSRPVAQQATNKLQNLTTSKEKLKEHEGELENLMNTIFRGIFVHRYRDILPEIRAVCLEELGCWMTSCPDTFLTDSYLKYLGWTLSDRHGEVRKKCVASLLVLYSKPEQQPRLELFSQRFKERLVTMVMDREPDTAMKTIQVLNDLRETSDGLLSKEDCETVYPYVFCSHRQLAITAGHFLRKSLLKQESEMASSPPSRPQETFVRVLLAFYLANQLHDHAAYLVDSLWDSAEHQLSHWASFTGLLLPKPQESALLEVEEGALLEIMVCCVRQAAEGQPPPGRGGQKKVFLARQKKALEDHAQAISLHFMVTLPQLLTKFSCDDDKILVLLEIPRYFDMSVYTSARLESSLSSLLNAICLLVETRPCATVHEKCSNALLALCDPMAPTQARVATDTLIDTIVQRFETVSHTVQSQLSSLDEDDVYELTTCLRRLCALYCAHDLTSSSLLIPCMELLRIGLDTGELADEVLMLTMQCAFYSVVWHIHSLTLSRPSKDELQGLRREGRNLIHVCQSFLSSFYSCSKEQAFLLLCDLLLLFGPHMIAHEFQSTGELNALESEGESWRILVLAPSPRLQAELQGFMVDHVFVTNETNEEDVDNERVAELYKRRRFLAMYLRLALAGILPLASTAGVFKHYVKFFHDYGDLMKEGLSRARLLNLDDCARTICLSLKQLFTEAIEESESQKLELSHLREVARRLAATFGFDLRKSRYAIARLHKEGLQFALENHQNEAPKTLHFLELLTEFSSKLLPEDKAVVLAYTEHLVPSPGQGLEWRPFKVYKASLNPKGEGRVAELSVVGNKQPQQDNHQESAEASQFVPNLTSTVMRNGYQKDMDSPDDENDFEIRIKRRAKYVLRRRRPATEELKHTTVPQTPLAFEMDVDSVSGENDESAKDDEEEAMEEDLDFSYLS